MVSFKDLRASILMLAFSIISAFVFNHLSPNGIAMFGQWQVEKGVISANSKNQSIDSAIEIDHPDLVLQIVNDKLRVVLDVRPMDFYDLGHLPGALSFPLSEFEENFERLQKMLEMDTPILVYCSGFTCDASHTFASRLIAHGYGNVKVFPGGFELWEQMGFVIEKNEK